MSVQRLQHYAPFICQHKGVFFAPRNDTGVHTTAGWYTWPEVVKREFKPEERSLVYAPLIKMPDPFDGRRQIEVGGGIAFPYIEISLSEYKFVWAQYKEVHQIPKKGVYPLPDHLKKFKLGWSVRQVIDRHDGAYLILNEKNEVWLAKE